MNPLGSPLDGVFPIDQSASRPSDQPLFTHFWQQLLRLCALGAVQLSAGQSEDGSLKDTSVLFPTAGSNSGEALVREIPFQDSSPGEDRVPAGVEAIRCVQCRVRRATQTLLEVHGHSSGNRIHNDISLRSRRSIFGFDVRS